jgi:hypothetical protein
MGWKDMCVPPAFWAAVGFANREEKDEAVEKPVEGEDEDEVKDV